jgi:hypothetical protein
LCRDKGKRRNISSKKSGKFSKEKIAAVRPDAPQKYDQKNYSFFCTDLAETFC